MTTKTYEHVGTLPLELGPTGPGKPPQQKVSPGEVFDAELPPEQEAFLIRAGAIRLHERREPKTAPRVPSVRE